jgi:hypothetical protein
MNKILIFGCGSIGAHMTNAALNLGFSVYITDIKKKKIDYFKNNFFFSRYGYFSKKIIPIEISSAIKIKEKFEIIIIGTPPDTHIKLLKQIKNNLHFKKILIEKPITTIFNKDLNIFKNTKFNSQVFCGYNHSISQAFIFFLRQIAKLKKIDVLNVFWKEGWSNILRAHPWLKSEFDSYLGDLKLGGGSLHEHSHGLHLLILILNLKKMKLSNNIQANVIYNFNKNKTKYYDTYSTFVDIVDNSFIKYETDLISIPANKTIFIKSKNKTVELIFGYNKNYDCCITSINNKIKKKFFKKTRSSEFENEIKYIYKNKNSQNTNLSPNHAFEVLKIINKCISYKQ